MLDVVKGKLSSSYLLEVQNKVTIPSARIKSRKSKNERSDMKENINRWICKV